MGAKAEEPELGRISFGNEISLQRETEPRAKSQGPIAYFVPKNQNGLKSKKR